MTEQSVRPRIAAVPTVSDLPVEGRYEVDPVRSGLEFTAKHLFGLGRVRGSFALSDGTLDVAEPVGESSGQVRIPVASVHSGNARRDETVKSNRLLNERSHPYITFRSGGLSFGPQGWVVAGELTVGESTRPIEVRVENLSMDGRELRLTALASVDRYDFGVTRLRGLAGRHLELRCKVVAHRA
jgi:polyisoprenoid-binding protein YceI